MGGSGSASLAEQFWVFTVSGVIVSWVPMIIGFVIHHKKLVKKIEQVTGGQTAEFRGMTSRQTTDIRHMTDLQTATLLPSRRRRAWWRRQAYHSHGENDS